MRKLALSLLIGLCLLGSACREIVEKEAEEKIATAEAALHEERWEEADTAFYEAILLDEDRAEAWIGRGLTRTQLGDPAYARTHYEQALTLYRGQLKEKPGDLKALRSSIMLLVLLNRSDEASALAEEAAREHPGEEGIEALPEFVEKMESEFADMILPPADENEEFPYPKTSPIRPNESP